MKKTHLRGFEHLTTDLPFHGDVYAGQSDQTLEVMEMCMLGNERRWDTEAGSCGDVLVAVNPGL